MALLSWPNAPAPSQWHGIPDPPFPYNTSNTILYAERTAERCCITGRECVERLVDLHAIPCTAYRQTGVSVLWGATFYIAPPPPPLLLLWRVVEGCGRL